MQVQNKRCAETCLPGKVLDASFILRITQDMVLEAQYHFFKAQTMLAEKQAVLAEIQAGYYEKAIEKLEKNEAPAHRFDTKQYNLQQNVTIYLLAVSCKSLIS